MRIEPPLELYPRRRRNPFLRLLFYAAVFAVLGLTVLIALKVIAVPEPVYRLLTKMTDRFQKSGEAPSPAPEIPVSENPSWDLKSPSVFKTKSSQAAWEKEEFHYEVPNAESLAGLTFQNGGAIDAAQFKTLNLRIAPAAGLDLPDFLRVEMKSGEQTLRVFGAKLKGEESLQFPLRFTSPAPITAISLVVTHAKAGTAKKGGFQVTHLSLA